MTEPTRGEVLHRSATVEASTGREFTGIGVPYGQRVSIAGLWTEEFAPGSVRADDALVLYRHDEPVGRITATRETAEGFEVTGTLSDTPRGAECQTLLRDGVLTKLSIGFEPVTWETRIDDDGDETIVFTEVIAREFSLVPFPAYEAASISSVRHAAPNPSERQTMTTPDTLTRADIEPLNNAISDLERQMTAHIDARPARNPGTQWRSMGDFLKALGTGDEAAASFHRDYAGMTSTTDIDGTFVKEFVNFVDDRRKLLDTFTRSALPAEGMSVPYLALEGLDAKVSKQAKEGDDLAGPTKVTFAKESAPVETYGGYTELSRQLIERSSVAVLNTALRGMGIAYAKETNKAVEATLDKVMEAQASSAITLPARADWSDWLAAIVDAGQTYDDRGFNLTGLLMSPDWFKELATVEATDGRPVMQVFGSGINTVGSVNLRDAEGNLANLPVRVLWGKTATAAFFDPVAIETFESPNAPAQLQDENIVNLTKQFSLYGYLAVAAPCPTAIVPVTKAEG